MNRIFAFVLSLLVFTSVQAQTFPQKAVKGKVVQILTHTSARNPYSVDKLGLAMIYVEGLPGACDTTHARVAIGSDHPLFTTVISLAISAQAQSKEIELAYLESCSVNSNSWDFSYMRSFE